MIVKSYEILKNPSKFINFNLFLLYGENDGLRKDIKTLIKNTLARSDSNIELISTQEKNIIEDEEKFYNSIFSGSLFYNKKIVTIHNGTDKITEQIMSIIEKKIENTFIIIFSDILEKKSKLRNLFEKKSEILCVPCYLDNFRDLEIIAKNELSKSNIILSSEIISLLIEKSNGNRNNLKNEIEKIKSFSFNKKNIEIDEIKKLISFSGEHKVDSLVNECLCGDIKQYTKILSELYTNTINQIFLLRILSNKIQRLINMKKNQKDNESIDSLLNTVKPPIFWKEKPMVKRQLGVWNLNELKKIIYEINDTEALCKKNPLISKLIFFQFFNKLCRKANNYS
tara:strand:+ start:191 stop:1210 length:1020 start_codon:yes stop_codon:yes gene_type:complete